MSMSKNNKKASLFGLLTGVAMGLVACSLVLIYTFAWFAIGSKKVDANGIGMQAAGEEIEASYFIEINEKDNTEGNLDVSSGVSIPGSSALFRIGIRNSFTSQHKIKFTSIGFNMPTLGVDESPKIVDGKNYYFGSQLEVEVSSASIKRSPGNSTQVTGNEELIKNITVSSTARKLLEMNTDGTPNPQQVVFSVNDSFYGTDNAILEYGNYLELVIKVSFINLDEPQDEYQDFGANTNEICQREIFVLYDIIN